MCRRWKFVSMARSDFLVRGPHGLTAVLLCAALSAGAGAAGDVELVGRLRIQVADDFAGGGVRRTASLRTAGTTIALDVAVDGGPDGGPDRGAAVSAMAAGSRVRVRGLFDAGTLVVDSIRFEQPRARAAAGGSENLGEQRTLVTLVNFTNDPTEPFSVADAHTAILDEANPDSAASYFREASYGRTWLGGSVDGWFSIPRADDTCQIWTDAGTEQLIEDLDAAIDFAAVDRWIVMIPENDACAFAGISTLGKVVYDTDDGTVSLSRAILNGFTSSRVAAHELGHGFGLLHAWNYECGKETVADDCDSSGLGRTDDRYDIMGQSLFGGHFSAANKEQLGWLADDLVEVSPPGGTFTLQPYETAGGGTKALEIPVRWNLDDVYGSSAYYVTFRRPVGFDDGFPELATDGAMLHLDARHFTGGDPGLSRLLDAKPRLDTTTSGVLADARDVLLEVGETLVDSGHGIEIDVLGADGGALEVSVAITRYCGNGERDTGVGEDCDGADFGGDTCLTLGYTGGALACTPSCTFDRDGCTGARCGSGHDYRVADDACVATVLADEADRSLWLNDETWSGVRGGATAFGASESFFLVLQRSDRSWIYRFSAPFDTSPIPDGREVFSAELAMKVLTSGDPFVNSHPDSADQLALVRTALASPPVAALGDFDAFGSVDAPVEGAPRVDVSESLSPGQPFSFHLDATGRSWIDTAGWTTLGIRAAYDVDDVTLAGEQVELRMGLRTSESPVAGPRLIVAYDAGPGTPDGAVCGDGIVSIHGDEQCDDGNAVSLDGCDANCTLEFCGDAIVNDDGAEACDDGNTVGLDGCDPLCRIETVLGDDARECLESLSRALTKLAVAESGALAKCVKKKARKGGAASACLVEEQSKVERARKKLARTVERRCTSLPAFGASDSEVIAEGAAGLVVAFLEDLLTDAPDLVMIRQEDDRAGSRCQESVLSAVADCHKTRLGAFDRCLRDGLDGAIRSESGLEDCMDSDPRGRIAKECGVGRTGGGALRDEIDRRCVGEGVDLSAAIPDCSTTDAATLDGCLDRSAACRVCRFLEAAHGLRRDCDSFDDGQANGSCS